MSLAPQFYWLWAPLNFEEFGAHYFVNDDEHGRAWNSNGVVIPTLDNDVTYPEMVRYESKLDYVSGRRHASHAEINLETIEGESWQLIMKPKSAKANKSCESVACAPTATAAAPKEPRAGPPAATMAS